MRILFVSSSSGSQGGGELYLIYLGRALVARGHEVGLFMNTHPRMDELAVQFEGLGPVIRHDFTNTYDYRLRSAHHLFQGSRGAREIAAAWRAFQPDVIHINKQNLEDGLDLLVAAEYVGAPSVVTVHMTQTARYLGAVLAGIRDGASRRFLRRFSGQFVTIAENRKRDLEAFLGRTARVENIDNGVCVEPEEVIAVRRREMRAELLVSDAERVIVSVGRLEEQKRPELFFEQAAVDRSSRCIWIGDGRLRPQMEQLIEDQKLSHVMITGWTDRVAHYLAAADVYVHTADYEGLPFSLLEAMAVGLPCFVRPALLADLPFDKDVELAEFGVGAVVADEVTLQALGRRARERVASDYSIEAMAGKYERVYRSCLS